MENVINKEFLVDVDEGRLTFLTSLEVSDDLEEGLDEAYGLVDEYLESEEINYSSFVLIDITNLERRDITT